MTGHQAKILTTHSPERQALPPKRPTDTQTSWEAPWAAAAQSLRDLADTATPFGRGGGLPDANAIGRQITEAINADPDEVERLRSARKSAREGRTYSRHSDTS